MRILASAGELSLRTVDDCDAGILARWRSDPRVMLAYAVYKGPVSESNVRSRYLTGHSPRDRATGRFYEYQACIVEERGQPVAFVQYHRLRSSDADLTGYPLDRAIYEMDLFVGNVELWGRGIGSKSITLTRDFLLRSRGAERVIAIPQADNARSIRAFERAGFRRVRSVSGAYAMLGRGDGVLMECV